MKQILSFSFSTLLVLGVLFVQAQNQETIEGNGNRITKTVSVQPFTELEASGVYDLKLTQGNSEGVTIEADENLQPLFTVRNAGNKLVIEMKELKNKNLKVKKNMVVQVQFRNLKAIDLKMVGSVRSENDLTFGDLDLTNSSVGNVHLDLNATKLNLENTSVGNVTLNGRAEQAVMKNSGVGSLKAGDFVVQTLDIDNSGVGSAEVNAAKGLKVQDSFLGKVKNKGAAQARNKKKVTI
jgi:hypothetical protein